MAYSAPLPTSSLPHAAAARRGLRSPRPGLAARGATLARLLLVPGAAEELLHEIGDRPGERAARAGG